MPEIDILVAEDVWGSAFDGLAARYTVELLPNLWSDRDRLVELGRQSRALVVRNRTQVDAALLAQLPDLEVVARAGVGLDNIDLAAADAGGIVVIAALGANAQSVAEHALGLALVLARDIIRQDRATRSGSWQRTAGMQIAGRTWGLLGAGATGRALGGLVSSLGAQVLGYDPNLDAGDPRLREAGIELTDLDRVVADSDVISIHLPATPETRGLVDRDFLRRVRPGALLINVGRGEVVDEDALVAALRAGRIGGAALDVRSTEPPTPGELETLDNVVLTPHVAGITGAAQERVATMLADDISALFAGGSAASAVGRVTRLRTALATMSGEVTASDR